MKTEQELEEALSRPTDADAEALATLEGDLLILGVSGKMGPSLARLARRACEKAGIRKRIIGVARFSDPRTRQSLQDQGIETTAGDLLDRDFLASLPDCPNVVFMAGQKFGTSGNQPLTWAMNTYVPALAAERFRHSRNVVFSSGNVYPFTTPASGGPTEQHAVAPVGEYAQSALGRERMFEFFSNRYETPVAILRLNYAIETRYGVLRDIGEKVYLRRPVNLAMGYVNVIWQRDANSMALRSFAHCSSPAFVLNMTGAEILAVRDLAMSFARHFGTEPIYEGAEAETALLSNAARCRQLFGPPEMGLDQMIERVGDWIAQGGRSLGKPTHFEERAGVF
jgi:nucleoside-diphosphate-sugar epimerase